MYNLIKLTADFDDSFVFFIISKDVHKTFNYLATQINSKNVNNPLFKFLVTNRKKLYDLNREIVFSSVKLDEVETEKRKLENKKVKHTEVSIDEIAINEIAINEETPIKEKKSEVVIIQEVAEPVVEEIKPKQKRNYTKKTKSGELDNTQNTVEEKPIEISEEIVKSPSDIETQSIEEKETDIIVKEATETTETPVQ